MLLASWNAGEEGGRGGGGHSVRAPQTGKVLTEVPLCGCSAPPQRKRPVTITKHHERLMISSEKDHEAAEEVWQQDRLS